MRLPAGLRETGGTIEKDSGLPQEHSTGQRTILGLLSSLLLFMPCMGSLQAAEQLEVQLDGMVLPINIDDISSWVSRHDSEGSELIIWLRLLDPVSKQGLQKLLNASLISNRSMARQMLRSWAGLKLLDEISDLVQVDGDKRGMIFLNTLEQLLKSQEQVTTLELLKALPASRIRIDLDELLKVANRWRIQLEGHQELLKSLRGLPASSRAMPSGRHSQSLLLRQPQFISLRVKHRQAPLRLQFWKSSKSAPSRQSWVALMPGLGGAPDHFRWLAKGLSDQGWPVVVLEHPGSDAQAVQALLEGRRPPPGAEVLPDRLSDLSALLKAHNQGELPIAKQQLVLMGHSLGALTAVLATGAVPHEGLEKRCQKALDGIPLTNLSQLLQCQLTDVPLARFERPKDLTAIIGLNSFGSLLWPLKGHDLVKVPVLFAGGTLDLITPPSSEQLALLLALSPHSLSRVILFEGGSHFSVIQVSDNSSSSSNDDDLFRLGDDLVGIHPESVRKLLSSEIKTFLTQVEANRVLEKSHHLETDGLRMHRLNRSGIEKLPLP